MKIRKAIIPAGGEGSRMMPATSVLPKELFTILDRPILDYIIAEAIESEIDEIIIIITKQKNAIRDYVLSNKERFGNVNFTFLYQEQPIGLGDAVYQAKNMFKNNEYFLVMLPDNINVSNEKIPVSKSLKQLFERNNCSIVNLDIVSPNEINLRAIVEIDQTISNNLFSIKKIVDKPINGTGPVFHAIAGRYILNTSIFHYIDISDHSIGNEIELTIALQNYIKDNQTYGFLFNGSRYDTGSINGYVKAFSAISLNDTRVKEDYIEWLRSNILA